MCHDFFLKFDDDVSSLFKVVLQSGKLFTDVYFAK